MLWYVNHDACMDNCYQSVTDFARVQFRTLMVMNERAHNGGAEILGVPQPSGKNFCCRKCRFVVCSSTNQVSQNYATNASVRAVH